MSVRQLLGSDSNGQKLKFQNDGAMALAEYLEHRPSGMAGFFSKSRDKQNIPTIGMLSDFDVEHEAIFEITDSKRATKSSLINPFKGRSVLFEGRAELNDDVKSHNEFEQVRELSGSASILGLPEESDVEGIVESSDKVESNPALVDQMQEAVSGVYEKAERYEKERYREIVDNFDTIVDRQDSVDEWECGIDNFLADDQTLDDVVYEVMEEKDEQDKNQLLDKAIEIAEYRSNPQKILEDAVFSDEGSRIAEYVFAELEDEVRRDLLEGVKEWENPEELLDDVYKEELLEDAAEKGQIDRDDADKAIENEDYDNEINILTEGDSGPYTDGWGNLMGWWEEAGRPVKLIDSYEDLLEDPEELQGKDLDGLLYGENGAINELEGEWINHEKKKWYVTEYLPENLDKLSYDNMRTANELLFQTIYEELGRSGEEIEEPIENSDDEGGYERPANAEAATVGDVPTNPDKGNSVSIYEQAINLAEKYFSSTSKT